MDGRSVCVAIIFYLHITVFLVYSLPHELESEVICPTYMKNCHRVPRFDSSATNCSCFLNPLFSTVCVDDYHSVNETRELNHIITGTSRTDTIRNIILYTLAYGSCTRLPIVDHKASTVFKIVDRCPDFVNETLKRSCENPLNTLPLIQYGGQMNVRFKNIHCANCHGKSVEYKKQLSPWKFKYNCHENVTSWKAIQSQISNTTCFMEFLYKSRPYDCEDVKYFEAILAEDCEQCLKIHTTLQKVFDSKDCIFCKVFKDISFLPCTYDQDPEDNNDLTRLFRLPDLQRDELVFVNQETFKSSELCADDENFDNIFAICRPFTCPAGKIPYKGACIEPTNIYPKSSIKPLSLNSGTLNVTVSFCEMDSYEKLEFDVIYSHLEMVLRDYTLETYKTLNIARFVLNSTNLSLTKFLALMSSKQFDLASIEIGIEISNWPSNTLKTEDCRYYNNTVIHYLKEEMYVGVSDQNRTLMYPVDDVLYTLKTTNMPSSGWQCDNLDNSEEGKQDPNFEEDLYIPTPGFEEGNQEPNSEDNLYIPTPGLEEGNQDPNFEEDLYIPTPGFGEGNQDPNSEDNLYIPTPGFGEGNQDPNSEDNLYIPTPGFGEGNQDPNSEDNLYIPTPGFGEGNQDPNSEDNLYIPTPGFGEGNQDPNSEDNLYIPTPGFGEGNQDPNSEDNLYIPTPGFGEGNQDPNSEDNLYIPTPGFGEGNQDPNSEDNLYIPTPGFDEANQDPNSEDNLYIPTPGFEKGTQDPNSVDNLNIPTPDFEETNQDPNSEDDLYIPTPGFEDLKQDPNFEDNLYIPTPGFGEGSPDPNSEDNLYIPTPAFEEGNQDSNPGSKEGIRVRNSQRIVSTPLDFLVFTEVCVFTDDAAVEFNEALQPLKKINCSHQLYQYKEAEYSLTDNGELLINGLTQTYSISEFYIGWNSIAYVCFNFSSELPQGLSKVQKYLSWVCTGLSCFCLLISIFLHLLLTEDNSTPRKLRLGLYIYLMLAQLLLQLPKLYIKICSYLAALSHYAWLSVFTWMTALAVHIYFTFGKFAMTAKFSFSFYKYLAVCTLFPLVVVAICFSLDHIPGSTLRVRYGQDSCTWISDFNGLIYFFYVPVAISLTVNIFGFCSAMWYMKRTSDVSLSEQGHYRNLCIIYIKMSSLMGFTWLFGFIAAFLNTKALWYVYIICNGLQGCFIFASFHFNSRTGNLLLTKLKLNTRRVATVSTDSTNSRHRS